ncbi:MAG: hypothetical protein IJI25_04145 [Eubacterium sp.]|nr:hypothetical protein [Eubacterium sp.]
MAAKSFKEIDEAVLQGVSGGYVFDTMEICREPNFTNRFEVINSTGEVIATSPYSSTAERMAMEKGESSEHLSWEQLQRLRETGSPY